MTTTVQKTTTKDIIPRTASAMPATQEREFHLLPAVDVHEDAQGLTLLADLPSVNRDGLNVRVEGDTLVLEARSALELPKTAKPIYAEQRALNFRRRFTLSSDLDTDKIDATLANGVLTLRIPKAAAAQPRQIPVKAG